MTYTVFVLLKIFVLNFFFNIFSDSYEFHACDCFESHERLRTASACQGATRLPHTHTQAQISILIRKEKQYTCCVWNTGISALPCAEKFPVREKVLAYQSSPRDTSKTRSADINWRTISPFNYAAVNYTRQTCVEVWNERGG